MTTSFHRILNPSPSSETQQIAERLAPGPVLAVMEWTTGGNSRIYKVETEEASYALKRYPRPSAQDPRNRLAVEAHALACMRRNGFTNVPEMIAVDKENGFGLLSWCEGDTFTKMRDEDSKIFADFLIALGEMSADAQAEELPPASEACVSGEAILSHIHKRLEKLKQTATAHEELNIFLTKNFIPCLEEFEDAARRQYQACRLSFADSLSDDQQTLTPSDFGAHNALRFKNSLIFLDFEYFGWDDPVTSAANFILHPAMTLTDRQKELFLDPMHVYFQARDPLYAVRLNSLFPLYAARWVTIILGEFIPEQWLHRLASGRYKPEEEAAVQKQQLEKARKVLENATAYSK